MNLSLSDLVILTEILSIFNCCKLGIPLSHCLPVESKVEFFHCTDADSVTPSALKKLLKAS